MKVKSGLEVTKGNLFSKFLGKRLGVLTNHAAVDSNYNHLIDLLIEAKCNVIKIFGPEHGFRGEAQDMSEVASCIDPITGIPVISLYGNTTESLSPKISDLKDIEALVVDVPDIGSRYYTFAQSVFYAMRAAKDVNIKIYILDRPNPIGGLEVEGSGLKKSCRSFCGYGPYPQRHGLSLGELCLMANQGIFIENEDATEKIGCDLEIIKVENWERSKYIDQTGLPWVIPSPNMPTLETAIVYPGVCLFEATQLSEGRGTTKPFEFIGAPFINSINWKKAVENEKLDLRGAILRPHSFIPKFQKHVDKVCNGLQIHVTNRETFKPLRWGLALIAAAFRLYPNEFSWRKTTYEFIDNVPAIDLLYGNNNFRSTLERGDSLESIEQELQTFENKFTKYRKQFLIY